MQKEGRKEQATAIRYVAIGWSLQEIIHKHSMLANKCQILAWEKG
jgi:hypothetical protein